MVGTGGIAQNLSTEHESQCPDKQLGSWGAFFTTKLYFLLSPHHSQGQVLKKKSH